MNKEVFETLPYVARKELIDLRATVKSFLDKYNDLIFEEKAESCLFQLLDFSRKYSFVINFHDYDKNKNINNYIVHYRPKSLHRIEGNSVQVTFSQIEQYFLAWIDYVLKMHEVTEEYFETFKKFYDEQFAEYFTNNDEDADELPFEVERQEVLFFFLTYAQKRIEASDAINNTQKTELLLEAEKIKESIPELTKKRIVEGLSRFAQHTKKFSNKLFHDIFDVIKKEAIKKVLYEGVEHLPNAVHKIQSWVTLLN